MNFSRLDTSHRTPSKDTEQVTWGATVLAYTQKACHTSVRVIGGGSFKNRKGC